MLLLLEAEGNQLVGANREEDEEVEEEESLAGVTEVAEPNMKGSSSCFLEPLLPPAPPPADPLAAPLLPARAPP